MTKVFNGDDSAYLAWLRSHPRGFVINTRRRRDPGYMVLHRSTCFSIYTYTKMARPGGFTERAYVKVCGDSIDELRRWVRSHGRADDSFSMECSLCKPS